MSAQRVSISPVTGRLRTGPVRRPRSANVALAFGYLALIVVLAIIGALVVVKRDHSAYARADGVARTLQAALEDWDTKQPQLLALARDLEAGRVPAVALDWSQLMAPLPRAAEWVDGSAYLNHVRLVRKARNAEPPATLETDPNYTKRSYSAFGAYGDSKLANILFGKGLAKRLAGTNVLAVSLHPGVIAGSFTDQVTGVQIGRAHV